MAKPKTKRKTKSKKKRVTKRRRARTRTPSVAKSTGHMVQAVTGLAVVGMASSVIKNM